MKNGHAECPEKEAMRKTVTQVLDLSIMPYSSLPSSGQQQVEGPPTDAAAWALVSYAESLRYSDLSPNMVAYAKQQILDSLGTAFGMDRASWLVNRRKAVTKEIGAPESTLIGSRKKTSATNTAIVNGAMIRYMDLNDTCWNARGFMLPSKERLTLR